MKKILFEGRKGSYLPEIPAYMDFVNECVDGWQAVEACASDQSVNPDDFDVVWRFAGLDFSGKGKFVVHEYNSLSVGSFHRQKDFVKRHLNARPQRRVFLNGVVENAFAFTDGVPSSLRDMGIGANFFAVSGQDSSREYDFVYSGVIRGREDAILSVLHQFRFGLSDASLLVVGEVPDDVLEEFREARNVTFSGWVPYRQVPEYLSKARYGLNLMPNVYPLNVQTATKVLEYCAAGLGVVTFDYDWVRKFEVETGGSFYFLRDDLSNCSFAEIGQFDFCRPDVAHLEWSRLIERSGVFEFLKDIP